MKKILLVLCMSIAIYSGYSMVTMEASTHWRNEQVVVHAGDTLWSIAGRLAENDEDVRAVIYRICEANKLDGNSYLLPGQRLLVPVRANNEYLAKK
ncbi:MAG: LysM peptidoglycan-binding domain-containing protein [Acidaminococcaceae bacterium]